MKYLIISLIISSYSLISSYPKMRAYYVDYVESSKCISKLVAQGFERSNIEINGNSCQIKGK